MEGFIWVSQWHRDAWSELLPPVCSQSPASSALIFKCQLFTVLLSIRPVLAVWFCWQIWWDTYPCAPGNLYCWFPDCGTLWLTVVCGIHGLVLEAAGGDNASLPIECLEACVCVRAEDEASKQSSRASSTPLLLKCPFFTCLPGGCIPTVTDVSLYCHEVLFKLVLL